MDLFGTLDVNRLSRSYLAAKAFFTSTNVRFSMVISPLVIQKIGKPGSVPSARLVANSTMTRAAGTRNNAANTYHKNAYNSHRPKVPQLF